MPAEKAIFEDERGRGWLVEIQFGHPAPTERGIYAARFVCPEDPAEPVRVGYLYRAALEAQHEGALRKALSEAEPARSIG